MPDVLDPEPSDKRTNEWKAWSARQAPVAPKRASLKDDPAFVANFFANFLAGIMGAGRYDEDTLRPQAKRAWSYVSDLIDWVEGGGPAKDRAAEIAKREEQERKIREDAELCAKYDRERLEKAMEEHGKIVNNILASGSAAKVA